MLKTKNIKVIEVSDWDNLVLETYGKPYNFQQQDGCKSKGTFNITIPSNTIDEFNDEIPTELNSLIMGVKFEKWLNRDPKKPVGNCTEYWEIKMWWERNFYPDVQIVANDLHKKGLIEPGEYSIEIDW